MNTEEIGYISKTHGLKGHVMLRLMEGIRIDETSIKSLFLDLNGSQVPYFIEECRPTPSGYILKLETIHDVGASKKLVGKKAFALTGFILEEEDSLNELMGYSVTDEAFGNIGVICEIDDQTENTIIKVKHPNGSEIILPFNDDFITEIDDDAKLISLKAPDGLIDLYLR